MVQLINQQRAAYGLPRLVEARGLDAAARDHDAWMAAHNDFCHECPGEPQIGARTGKYGYSWSGEIIAGGPPTPAEAVRAWMESPGHRAAILSDAVTVGCDLFAVTSPAVGQFPFYETCDFSRDPLHDAPLLTSTPAPSSTPSRVFLPTLTATPMPTITPAPTWTPYAVWPTPNRTIMPPLTLASPTPTATPSAGGAYWLTITLSPWSGASLQTQASRWLCGQFGVTCRWEVR